MSREGVALPGTGAPAQEYDRMNEAQYRAAVEQALARLSAAIREIEELSDDLTITGAWTFDPGPVVVGTDPGGSALMRVGGSARVAEVLSLDGGDAVPGSSVVGFGESSGNLFINARSSINVEVDADASGAGDFDVRTQGVTKLEVRNNGNIIMPDLPTSDPTVAGALWNDSGTLKVSSG